MNTKYIEGQNGYNIPYIQNSTGNENKTIIVSHGFSSSKNSPTAMMIVEGMAKHGFGTIAFDFPNHGDSQSGPEGLRIDNCIRDLQSIENLVRHENPNSEILYFSSSFGAYINLQYLTNYEHKGTKSFLRSAAVNMPELFTNPTPEEKFQLETYGKVSLDYEPPITITSGFIDDLLIHNLFEVYTPGSTKVEMVHGSVDSTIAPEQAEAFALKFNIPITVIPHGEHRLMDAGQPEKVFDLALKMFCKASHD